MPRNPAHSQLPAPVPSMLGAMEEQLLNQPFSGLASVNEICSHVLTGGKRLRPCLLLTVGCALQADRRNTITLATAVELMHAATLVHDDVIDGAVERRHRPSVNHKWGMRHSILAGDLLYAQAFAVISLQQASLCHNLAQTACSLAESEFMQLEREQVSETNAAGADGKAAEEKRYFRIIEGKTASLFRFCALAPALHCEAGAKVAEALAVFGNCFGLAFQLTDDALDCENRAGDTGKDAGKDLLNGNRTLTINRALMQADRAGRQAIEAALNTAGTAAACDRRQTGPLLQQALQAIADTDAVAYTRRCADEQTRQALHALDILPDSPYRQALSTMTQAIAGRRQ